MKKLIFIPLLFLSIVGYSQMNTFGGIGLRVNDTTTYQTNAAAYHTAGYYDLYFNNQATNDHFDVWNGSSYDHIFSFSSGGNFWKNAGATTLTGSVDINLAGFDVTFDDGGNTYAEISTTQSNLQAHDGSDNTLIEATPTTAVMQNNNNNKVEINASGVLIRAGNSGDDITLTTGSTARLTIDSDGSWDLGAGLDPGTSTYVLTSNGAGAAPTWTELGAYTAYTPTITGFAGTPTSTARYTIIGKILMMYVVISGTSNATTFTFTLPSGITSANTVNQLSAAGIVNNSAASTTMGLVQAALNSNVVSVFRDFQATAFTSSGTKGVTASLMIEIQ